MFIYMFFGRLVIYRWINCLSASFRFPRRIYSVEFVHIVCIKRWHLAFSITHDIDMITRRIGISSRAGLALYFYGPYKSLGSETCN